MLGGGRPHLQRINAGAQVAAARLHELLQRRVLDGHAFRERNLLHAPHNGIHSGRGEFQVVAVIGQGPHCRLLPVIADANDGRARGLYNFNELRIPAAVACTHVLARA